MPQAGGTSIIGNGLFRSQASQSSSEYLDISAKRTYILFMAASFTAQTMALQRALETARPAESRLFTDPLAIGFLTQPLRTVAAIARIPMIGQLVARAYDAALPGPRPSAVARTRLIDDTVADLVDAGIHQVVLLGAGFDGRAWRLESLRSATVIEIDRPQTQEVKEAAVRRAGLPCDHVVFVPVDFESMDLESSLQSVGFTEDPALFLWEGVTNYLTADAVDRTLAAIRALASPGSSLLFTFVHAGAIDGSVAFPEAARWSRSVTRVGEPWTFGLRPDELTKFLAERGYDLIWQESTATAGRRYFDALGRADRASELYRVALASITCPA